MNSLAANHVPILILSRAKELCELVEDGTEDVVVHLSDDDGTSDKENEPFLLDISDGDSDDSSSESEELPLSPSNGDSDDSSHDTSSLNLFDGDADDADDEDDSDSNISRSDSSASDPLDNIAYFEDGNEELDATNEFDYLKFP
uniref:Uncharacterized protein n=1 Tax=Panagrolaimus superbus TaxID=310955 RepID=A0A914ZFE8_9BILA